MNYSRLLKVFIISKRLEIAVADNITADIEKTRLEALNELSVQKRALLSEDSAYPPDISTANLLEDASLAWISGQSLEEAAAAAKLAEPLPPPGKSYASEPDRFIVEKLNKQTIVDILKAA